MANCTADALGPEDIGRRVSIDVGIGTAGIGVVWSDDPDDPEGDPVYLATGILTELCKTWSVVADVGYAVTPSKLTVRIDDYSPTELASDDRVWFV